MSGLQKRWIVFLIVTVLCGLIITALFSIEPQEVKADKKIAKARSVLVERVSPSAHRMVINSFGTALSLWETKVKSEVEGKIVFVSDSILEGSRVRKGERLVEVDKTPYLLAVHEAEVRFETAKVELLKERRRSKRAIADWHASGMDGEPSSPLVFKKPQLNLAESEVKAAEYALKKAKSDLNKTTLKAPYAGVVKKRYVSRGEVLFSGENIVDLISDDVEVKVSLDGSQLSAIGDFAKAEVAMRDVVSKEWVNGKIVRSDGYFDDKTRLINIYIKPQSGEGVLLAGNFLKTSIYGKTVGGALSLHESSVTRDGLFWYVENGVLKSSKADVLFYKEGNVIISDSIGFESVDVVLTPVQSYIDGMKVEAVYEDGEER